MKRHLQCAEQQVSSTNVTKYCACHEKWLASLILVTYETSFTMRGATGITLQPHQILRLPRKMTLMIDVRHTWHVIYNARSNRSHPPTSPNAAPATQNDSHHLSVWHMKRYLQCAEEQASSANLTKYCACHAKWLASSILVTYETSFPMRGATGISLQPDQILRLPRKIAPQKQRKMRRKQLKRQFQCGDDSSMIRAWSDHDPTMNSSSRTRPFAEVTFRASETHFVLKITTFRAPAIYPDFTEYCACHEKWHSDITKYCACHEKWHSDITKYCACHVKWLSWLMSVTYETSFPMRGATGISLQPDQILRLPRKIAPQKQRKMRRKQLKRQFQCGDDSSMIRPWSDHELVISHPPVRGGYFSRFGDAFCIENYNISRSGYLPRFHRILRLPRKVPLQDDEILRLPRKVTLQDHQILRLPRKVTLRHHQILRLPRKVTMLLNCYWTELLLSCYWAVTKLLLSCYWTVTELTCYWTVTGLSLNCYWTDLLLSCYWPVTELSCYWTELWLNCYWTVTELLLNWPVTERLLTCYWTELLLNCYWTVTELNCYWTDLLLSCYWTELLLNCYWTELLLNCYWTVTQLLLNWPVTELLLNWAVTQLLLDCYWTVTELTCYWTELLLNCYWTELLLNCYWTVTELLLNWPVTELLLSWAVTELLLNWTVTELLLNCHWTVTELTCYWAVTELSCYWAVTELNCYWTVTGLSLNCYWTDLLLSCYWTELLLNCYWTVTELLLNWPVTELLLNCYFALLLELLLYWTLCIFKSP